MKPDHGDDVFENRMLVVRCLYVYTTPVYIAHASPLTPKCANLAPVQSVEWFLMVFHALSTA